MLIFLAAYILHDFLASLTKHQGGGYTSSSGLSDIYSRNGVFVSHQRLVAPNEPGAF